MIGPRPTLASVPYDELTSDQKKRYQVRPGITGYSQAYFRNSIGNEEKLKNDCFYVDNVSLILDIKIFIQTAVSVLRHKNIYVSSDAKKNESKRNG